MTLEQRRAYFKTWRDKRVADGKCWSCCKSPAGGPNGTKTRCGICAEKNRQITLIRYYRLHPTSKAPTYTPVLVKRGPEPERGHVTWLELSAGRSNT